MVHSVKTTYPYCDQHLPEQYNCNPRQNSEKKHRVQKTQNIDINNSDTTYTYILETGNLEKPENMSLKASSAPAGQAESTGALIRGIAVMNGTPHMMN